MRGGVSKPIKVKCLPKIKGPTGVPKVTRLGKALKPATLEERLVAGDLQPSVVAKVLPLYEKRDKPEVPNHVKDMAAEEGDIASVVDATVAGAPVQTGVKETVGIDTLNDMESIDVDTLVSMAPEGFQVESIFELDETEIGKLLSVSNSQLFGGDAHRTPTLGLNLGLNPPQKNPGLNLGLNRRFLVWFKPRFKPRFKSKGGGQIDVGQYGCNCGFIRPWPLFFGAAHLPFWI